MRVSIGVLANGRVTTILQVPQYMEEGLGNIFTIQYFGDLKGQTHGCLADTMSSLGTKKDKKMLFL